jgi:GT2 family glycosyltransferase
VPSTKTDPRPRDFTGEVTSGVLYPANMVASRRGLQGIGGFDERRSLLVAEDNDLCYRWLADGRTLRYEPDLVVWHHDWRTPEQLLRTHLAYARAQGGFYAKHLHDGDRRVLRLLRRDLRHGVRSVLGGALRRRPRWEDPYREMVLPLLAGLVAGWREARTLGRAGVGRPPSPASG